MGDEKPFYEKHKIFLYKEDFEKFIEGLNDAITHIKANGLNGNSEGSSSEPDKGSNHFTNVSFDRRIGANPCTFGFVEEPELGIGIPA